MSEGIPFDRASISPPQVVRHPLSSQPWIIPAVVWGGCDCVSRVQRGKRCNQSRTHCQTVYRSCRSIKCTISTSVPRVIPTTHRPTMPQKEIVWTRSHPTTRATTTLPNRVVTEVMVKLDTEKMSTAPANTNDVLIGGLIGGVALLALVIVLLLIAKFRRKNRPDEGKPIGSCMGCFKPDVQSNSFEDPVYIPPEMTSGVQGQGRSANNLANEQNESQADDTEESHHDYEQVYEESESANYQHLNMPHISGADVHPGISVLNDHHDDGHYSMIELDSVSNTENVYSTIKYSSDESSKYFVLQKSDETDPSTSNSNIDSTNGVYYDVSPSNIVG